jgi:AcrR family transcriptional regulator
MSTRPLQSRTVKNRESLVSAARALFRAQGYEATTIDQIAAGAGVARRTFFRHFPSKEAVIFPHADARIAAFREALRPRAGEGPEQAVRRAVLETAREFARHKDEQLLQHDLVASSPELAAYEQRVDRRWEEALFEALLEVDGDELAARVLAGALCGGLRAVLRVWLGSRGKLDLAALGAKALDALAETSAAWLAEGVK